MGVANGIAMSHYNLGFTLGIAGDPEAGNRYFLRALREFENLGDRLGASNALAGLAAADRITGNYERGRQRAAESLTQQRLLGDEFAATTTLSMLGSITSRTGPVEEAETMLREALVLHERAGDVSGIVWMLHELAATAASRGPHERAIRLSGAARSLEGKLGGGIPVEGFRLDELVQAAWNELEPADALRASEKAGSSSRQQESMPRSQTPNFTSPPRRQAPQKFHKSPTWWRFPTGIPRTKRHTEKPSARGSRRQHRGPDTAC